jgi:phosphatidylserine/phosphatidylglycerophosphate/cardiolipin synthase-like enzyme
VYIEQQYIRGSQEKIGQCMQAIADAHTAHPDLDIRIIVARPFPGKTFDKEAKAIRDLRRFGVKLGANIRILNPKNFVHCHNKLIVVDDTTVLISSQNWSDAAVFKNREAGLLLHYPEMARHYSKIFQSDWETAQRAVTRKTTPELFGPESLATGKTVPINPGDYVVFGDDEDFRPPRKHPADAAVSAERVSPRRRRPARPRVRSAGPRPKRRPRKHTGKR